MSAVKKITICALVLQIPVLFFLGGCGPKPLEQQSLFDTPENHYNQGMREFEAGRLDQATEEFERATGLDKDYPGGYVGMGLVLAEQGSYQEALKSVDKGIGKDDRFIDGYVAKGRIITAWKKDDNWLKEALKPFEKALKIVPESEKVLFYMGEAYKEAYQFADAASIFSRVISQKGDFAGRANMEWELVQKIQRAAPGTRIGMKIALIPEIDRSDLAVLFVEELKLLDLLKRYQPRTYDTKFRPPADPTQPPPEEQAAAQSDYADHWAKNWIISVIKTGVMDLFPDGDFHPDDLITRANYAQFLQNILVAVTGDQSLATKYVGSVSRFPDVNPSHYAYNAICLAVDRGIMKADTMTGAFGMSEPVSGADALLIIREFQNALRMTF